MRRTATLCATAVAVALMSGLASSPTVAGDEPKLPTEEFHDMVQSLVDAENWGDAAAMTALFTEDAILLPRAARSRSRAGTISAGSLTTTRNTRWITKITPSALTAGFPRPTSAGYSRFY